MVQSCGAEFTSLPIWRRRPGLCTMSCWSRAGRRSRLSMRLSSQSCSWRGRGGRQGEANADRREPVVFGSNIFSSCCKKTVAPVIPGAYTAPPPIAWRHAFGGHQNGPVFVCGPVGPPWGGDRTLFEILMVKRYAGGLVSRPMSDACQPDRFRPMIRVLAMRRPLWSALMCVGSNVKDAQVAFQLESLILAQNERWRQA